MTIKHPNSHMHHGLEYNPRHYNAFRMSNEAGCGSPDSPESPGAGYLISVRDAIFEHLDGIGTEWYDDTLDAFIENSLVEVVDGLVPIYTSEIWATFVDLAGYLEDMDELAGPDSDMEARAQIAMYLIGERLARALIIDWGAYCDENGSDANDAGLLTTTNR